MQFFTTVVSFLPILLSLGAAKNLKYRCYLDNGGKTPSLLGRFEAPSSESALQACFEEHAVCKNSKRLCSVSSLYKYTCSLKAGGAVIGPAYTTRSEWAEYACSKHQPACKGGKCSARLAPGGVY